jgi:hypothetical protein
VFGIAYGRRRLSMVERSQEDRNILPSSPFHIYLTIFT